MSSPPCACRAVAPLVCAPRIRAILPQYTRVSAFTGSTRVRPRWHSWHRRRRRSMRSGAIVDAEVPEERRRLARDVLERYLLKAQLLEHGQIRARQWPGHRTWLVLRVTPGADDEERSTGRDTAPQVRRDFSS